jgi:hypothetical protein
MRRAELKWNKGRFCSKACHLQFRQRSRRPVPCELPGCVTPAYRTSKDPGRRFCSAGHYNAWRALTYGGARNEARAIDSRARVVAAWDAGTRGPRRLAAAAGASTKTVYKVLRAEGRDVGSDAAAAHQAGHVTEPQPLSAVSADGVTLA